MARGWESKEVESQQAQAEYNRRGRKKRLTPEELERDSQRHLVQLDISRIEREMASTTHPRRTAQLQAALEFLRDKARLIG
ncbi:MAG: hypothetical protein IT163_19970 [Bryobacterales bacterium]|nr:hypothetical protein [Bryobacterales bacterium]